MKRLLAPLCALPLLALAAEARAAELSRSPYLQSVTSTSAVVVWKTSTATDGELRYGKAPDALDQALTSKNGAHHEVKITGLTPGQRVYYSVGEPGAPLAGGDAQHHFSTAPAAGERKKFRAWVVGDSGTGGSNQAAVREAMLAAVGKSRPSLFLHMGDMAYNSGTTQEFTDNFFGMYPGILATTPLYPTIGNHEGLSSDSGTQSGPYYDAYALPKGGEAGGLPSGTEAYYAFDWANVHFVVLDSHDSSRKPDGPMLTWLKSDLAATQQEWIIAYWHHPPYTKGSHNSDTEGQLIEMRENALPILEAAGVDLVLAGHSHIYERSFLVDGAYDTPTTAAGKIVDKGDGKPLGSGPYQKPAGVTSHKGAVYVVAGHGGAGVEGPANHPLMAKSELKNGSCLLDVHENRLSMFNVRADGQISDRFTLVKGTGLVIGYPDGGETLAPGDTVSIEWATVGSISKVRLDYSLDNGQSWLPIAGPIDNSGKHPWVIPPASSELALVRVVDAANPTTQDESNGSFRVGGPQTLIPLGSVWKFHDKPSDPGPSWASLDLDDSAWPEGPAQLGYGDGDEATTLQKESPVLASAYFRKTIDLGSPLSSASVKVTHDDGVAVFVNGKEVFNRYIDDTSHKAFSASASEDNEVNEGPVDPAAFVVGKNIVAAVVKQANSTSSDLSFDLELTATPEPPPVAGAAGAAGAPAAGAGGSSAGSPAAGAGGSSAGAPPATGGASQAGNGQGGNNQGGNGSAGKAGAPAAGAPGSAGTSPTGGGKNTGGVAGQGAGNAGGSAGSDSAATTITTSNGESEGCGCRQAGAAQPGGWGALLALAALARRRRRP